MSCISFTIPGVPGSKGRGRAVPIYVKGQDGKPKLLTKTLPNGKIVPILRVATPTETVDWEATVRQYGHDAMAQVDGVLLEGPLELDVTVYYVRTKGRTSAKGENPPIPKDTKPDFDNLAKAISDALNGICYRDDAQISDGITRKRWAAGPGYGDTSARTEVRITELVEGAVKPRDQLALSEAR